MQSLYGFGLSQSEYGEPEVLAAGYEDDIEVRSRLHVRGWAQKGGELVPCSWLASTVPKTTTEDFGSCSRSRQRQLLDAEFVDVATTVFSYSSSAWS